MRAPALVSRLRDMEAPLGRCVRARLAFRVRRQGDQLLSEEFSHRHTAIAVIRLAGEDEAVPIAVLAGV